MKKNSQNPKKNSPEQVRNSQEPENHSQPPVIHSPRAVLPPESFPLEELDDNSPPKVMKAKKRAGTAPKKPKKQTRITALAKYIDASGIMVSKKNKEQDEETEERESSLPALLPKYEPKHGFGVSKSALTPETPLVRIWRKDMLKTYTSLQQFGNLGILHPDMMMKVLQELNYDMTKLDTGESKKKKSFQKGSPFTQLVKLMESRQPYIHSHTSSSTIIETADTIYLYGCNGYNFKELHLRRKLKTEIAQNIAEKNMTVPHLSNDDSNYMVYSNWIKEQDLEMSSVDVVEFDISKAYYACAHYLGYMGEEMYKQCISLPKEIRLRFIGSIATFKRHYLRNGFNITGYSAETNELLRNVWFHIVKHVDDCMLEFQQQAGDNFIMYYVDGIYLKKYKPGKVGEPAERIDYSPILDYIKNKYGFVFATGEIYGITRLYLKSGRSKHNGLNIFKKNDFERPAFTGYWMRKQFSIKGGGRRELDTVPQWQLLLDAYEQAGGDAAKAAKLIANSVTV